MWEVEGDGRSDGEREMREEGAEAGRMVGLSGRLQRTERKKKWEEGGTEKEVSSRFLPSLPSLHPALLSHFSPTFLSS